MSTKSKTHKRESWHKLNERLTRGPARYNCEHGDGIFKLDCDHVYLSLMLLSPPLSPSSNYRIVLSTPLAVLCYFLIWYVPPFENGKVIWYLFFYCLFQSLQTVSSSLANTEINSELGCPVHAVQGHGFTLTLQVMRGLCTSSVVL